STIGTLSGLRRISRKLSFIALATRKPASASMRPRNVSFRANHLIFRNMSAKRIVAIEMSFSGAASQLIVDFRKSSTFVSPSDRRRAGDAAVLPDAPEVDRDQDDDDEGERDAVEHVEAEQRRLADEP